MQGRLLFDQSRGSATGRMKGHRLNEGQQVFGRGQCVGVGHPLKVEPPLIRQRHRGLFPLFDPLSLPLVELRHHSEIIEPDGASRTIAGGASVATSSLPA